MRRFLGVLLLMTASAASAADQFDLICTARGMKAPSHYRLDLAKSEWCNGACPTTFKFHAVTPTRITFSQHDPAFRGDEDSINFVDRTTGDWTYISTGRLLGTTNQRGHCEPAPFTGFGAERAKF